MEAVKREVYLFFSVLFGFLVSFLVHAGIEIWYIGRLIENFDIYGLGFSWSTWFFIHDVLSIILALLGVVGGYFIGKRWWHIVYVEKHRRLYKST